MKTYEQLRGAEGRKIFYRAERFGARDLFHGLVPDVEVDKRPLTLHDLSMSGLAVITNGSSEWTDQVGADVPIRLRIGRTVLHRGRGRICRVEQVPFGTKIGLGLTSGYLDIPRIVARQEELSIRRTLEAGLEPALDRVAPDYRRIVADVLHLLRRYQSVLRRVDGRGNGSDAWGNGADRWADNGDGRGNGQMDELLALCEERIVPEWRRLWHEANDVVMPIMEDPEALRAAKRLTELVLTPEFLAGPIWRRSYEKPLGYPGDYEVMRYVYAWQREGDTAYGKLLHRIGLEVAECIATRMVEMQHTIARTVAAAPAGAAVRVMSLGCGPAQEVVNYLQLKALRRPIEFTLIDQEYRALSHAYHRVYPETVRLDGAATVRCLQVSFVQLMKDRAPFAKLAPQDLIYTVGLIDYLAPHRVRRLVARLYDQLAPGGLLVIGNMRDTRTGNLWPMEFVCDWSLNYRNEAEMWAFAEGLKPAWADLGTDPTGRVYLLYLRKPGGGSGAEPHA